MARLNPCLLGLTFSALLRLSCARLRRVDEQSDLEAPSHVDFADVLDRAVSLMDEGISNFLEKKQSHASLRNEKNTAMSLLSEMSGNVKALRKVVAKMKKHQHREAAKNQKQLKQLSLAAAREKQYQTDLLKLQNFSSQCEMALKRCPPTGVARGLMPELKQIKFLQGLNDELREKVGQLGNQKRVLQNQFDDVSAKAKESEALTRKLQSVEADNRELQATLQQATQGIEEKIQDEVAEGIAEAKAKMEDGFAARKQVIKRQQEKLLEKSEDSQEVATDLQKQNVKYQKTNIHLHVANQRLQRENQALRDDKSHLMDSMQMCLSQSASYQQELVAYEKKEGCKSPSNKTVAGAKPGAVQCQCSGDSSPYSSRDVFSAEDIAKAKAEAAATGTPVTASVSKHEAEGSGNFGDPTAHMTEMQGVDRYVNDPANAPVESTDPLSAASFSTELTKAKNKYEGDFAIDDAVPVYTPKSQLSTSDLEASLTLPSRLHPKGEVEVKKAEAAFGVKHVDGEKVLAGYLDGEPPPADIQAAATKKPSQEGAQKMPQGKSFGASTNGQAKAPVNVKPKDTADASAQLLLKAEQEIAEAGNDN
eukprot:gnl/MRDRNA2_/MRDRNA2_100712_c0_seq1.p1 gnl/MRDRNA2_/MRDRNA2_100712_c0~~gnl/MRDRNA2_/MRDRNA2_100712_c0_seq1.p1  ORF type:complete len:592 (+),score=168.09 gnl/MRDRNA2_/MRDRNA2_100712_c0_seq1:111-1886(+)